MKKQLTILSTALLVSAVSTAQVKSNATASYLSPNQFSKAEKHIVSDNNTSVKAGGDQIWSSALAFTDTVGWTKGNVGTGVQGVWKFGAYPTNFNNYVGAMPSSMTAPLVSFDAISILLAAQTTPVGIQNAYVATPSIDLSASNLITITASQAYRRFNYDKVFVEASTDGGATWTISKQVNTDAVNNGATLMNTLSVDLLIGPGVTNGKIRFRWESLTAHNQQGSGYGWALDNIKIVEGYEDNLNLYRAFNEYGTQRLSVTKMPVAQAATAGKISFGAHMENVGVNTQPASVGVTAPSYTQSSAVENLVAFAQDSFSILLNDGFPIPSTIGVYNFTLFAKSDSVLNNLFNDTIKMPFEVTNSIYAADRYTTPASITSTFTSWLDQAGEGGIGNLFEIFADAEVGAVQVGIGNVSSQQQATYLGRNIFAEIYVYNEVTDDFDYIDRSEDHSIVAANFGNLVKCYFPTLPSLTAGKTYLVIGGTYENEVVPIACSGFNITGNTMGKSGTSFANLASTENQVRCPVVRLDFTDYTGINEVSSVSNVSVSPNPFVGTTDVKVSLKNNATVSAVVTDLSGRTVATIPAANMISGDNTISINGANFQAGVYTVTLTVGAEKITKRIVKN